MTILQHCISGSRARDRVLAVRIHGEELTVANERRSAACLADKGLRIVLIELVSVQECHVHQSNLNRLRVLHGQIGICHVTDRGRNGLFQFGRCKEESKACRLVDCAQNIGLTGQVKHHVAGRLACIGCKRDLCGQLVAFPLQRNVQERVCSRILQDFGGRVAAGCCNRAAAALLLFGSHDTKGKVAVICFHLQREADSSLRGLVASAVLRVILPIEPRVETVLVVGIQFYLIGQSVVALHGVTVLQHCVAGSRTGHRIFGIRIHGEELTVANERRSAARLADKSRRVILVEEPTIQKRHIDRRNLNRCRRFFAVRRHHRDREGQEHCKDKGNAENLFHF